ncbi:hypothetical protein N0V90_001428 [Kalmusia sp. IMI 367209]|nr:hypothetical protein N0V90_001428 [Kalmusia sp. IMI 367209]
MWGNLYLTIIAFDLSFHTDGGDVLNFDTIASDSGLFAAPVETNDVAISMGERYELVIDFSSYKNQNITLLNGRGLGENVDYPATDKVMRFVVGGRVNDGSNNGDVPRNLRNDEPVAADTSVAKDFIFSRSESGHWVINGVGFADIENRILTRPERGTDEIWLLHNGAGGATHPVHIHLVDFKVLSRSGGRGQVADYESAGWKDVVWLAAGETVQVVARYAPWDGVYMFHCHNMVHEDNDMLVAFNVSNLAKWGYTNDTEFIDPMQPEFRPKDYNSDDFTEGAIKKKIRWLYSTDPYNHGNIQGVYSALDAGLKGEQLTQESESQQQQQTSAQSVSQTYGAGSSQGMPSHAWTTLASPANSQTASSSSTPVTPVPTSE